MTASSDATQVISRTADLRECEQFAWFPPWYGNCRHERLTPEKCDRWRIAHGLQPLNPENATAPSPDQQMTRTGHGGTIRGWGGKRAASEAAPGSRALMARQPIPTPETLPCIHRGDVLETVKTPGCGCASKTTAVYACAAHVECTLRRARDTRGIVRESCVGCDERVA